MRPEINQINIVNAGYGFGDNPIFFGPIVLRQTDSRLKQHTDFAAALAEATRLARKEEASFAVYVPVKVAKRPERPVEVVDLLLPKEVQGSAPISMFEPRF